LLPVISRRLKIAIAIAFSVLFLFFLLLNTSLGTVSIPFSDVWKALTSQPPEDPVHHSIILNIRLPRVLLGILVGATLAVCGNLFQALLRNPLADPYILGVSSGAAFGIVLSIGIMGSMTAIPAILYNLPLMSFSFAMLAAFSSYFIAKRGAKTPVVDLILSGVIVNFLFNAGTTFAIVFLWRNIQSTTYWLMGSLSGASWTKVSSMALATGIAILFGLIFSVKLNAISLGEEEAMNLGVNVHLLKFLIFITVSLLTAYCVSVAGIVGFVGLIIPHSARLITGPDHKKSIPFSALLGGLFLSSCDTIARTMFAPIEMPLGTITALVGAPVFIFLLRKKMRTT